MGFFYISAPYLEKSKEATNREINDVVIKKSIADGKEIAMERSKFKVANLDTLMLVNDKLLKLETGLEAFLKKIDRQFLDLQEKQSHEWFIKAGDREVMVPRFLYDFRWNEAKYPRNYPIQRITETLENRLLNSETDLRNRTNAYNETKSNLAQNTQKEYGMLNAEGTTSSATSPTSSSSPAFPPMTSSTPSSSPPSSWSSRSS